jgi:hypothetical protein
VTRAQAVALSDRQQRMVSAHAASLPVVARDCFLRSIADSLRGEPSDTAVEQAVNIALDRVRAFSNGTMTNNCC